MSEWGPAIPDLPGSGIRHVWVNVQRILVLVFTLVALAAVSGAIWSLASWHGSDFPSQPHRSTTPPAEKAPVLDPHQPRVADLLLIPAGTVEIGDNNGPPAEKPEFLYTAGAFLMDRTPVTVSQFAAFAKNTGYRTDAERYGSGGVLDERLGGWEAVDGANWRRPLGPGGAHARADHPVTQVSWFDANAFCKAYGLRLLTEFEWERAARMGQTPDGHVFWAGDPIERNGQYLLNAWEGSFPLLDTGADGYRNTSPVGAFGTTPSGLTDMAGNIWQWTSSWYLPYSAIQREPGDEQGERVSRGGSFLCSPQLCQGYRASARNHATPDTSLENVGFRCAADPGRVSNLAGRIVQRATRLARASGHTPMTGGTGQ